MSETRGSVGRTAVCIPPVVPPRWAVVVPVKGGPHAKSRLGSLSARVALAEAFALDTVAALVAASAVERVFVVTDSVSFGYKLTALGAIRVPEEPASPVETTGHARLNAAIALGVAAARGACPHAHLAVMTGDLPALRPSDIEAAFGLAAQHSRSLVADVHGAGTTTLFAQSGVSVVPRFGRDSCAAHTADGHVVLAVAAESSLRRDVDTVADLEAARALGVGPRTQAVLMDR